jgi:hypothetical protein
VLTLNHEGEGALDKKGTLYILAIGVDRYPGLGNTCGALGNESCDLAVSVNDARALVAEVEKRLGPEHDKVVKRLLFVCFRASWLADCCARSRQKVARV